MHSKHKSLKNCHKVFFYYGKLTAIFLVKSHLHNGPFNFPEIFLSNRKSDFCALCNSIIRKSKQNFCITTSGSVLEAAKLRSNPNLRWWKVPSGATCEPSCKAKWWTKDQGQPWLRKVKSFVIDLMYIRRTYNVLKIPAKGDVNSIDPSKYFNNGTSKGSIWMHW